MTPNQLQLQAHLTVVKQVESKIDAATKLLDSQLVPALNDFLSATIAVDISVIEMQDRVIQDLINKCCEEGSLNVSIQSTGHEPTQNSTD